MASLSCSSISLQARLACLHICCNGLTRASRTWLPKGSISTRPTLFLLPSTYFHPSSLAANGPSSLCPYSETGVSSSCCGLTGVLPPQRKPEQSLTWRTKMLNLVFSSPRPSFCLAISTSFSNSLTAYSKVVRVSSTSSTISMFLPTKLDISREERSSHWVRVTLVPGSSTGPFLPRFS